MRDNLDELVKIIRERKGRDPKSSYSAQLLSSGLESCIDKLEEEFNEFKEALGKKKNEIHEAADLIYHFLISLEVADIKYEDILDELDKRKNKSGVEEKKSRKNE